MIKNFMFGVAFLALLPLNGHGKTVTVADFDKTTVPEAPQDWVVTKWSGGGPQNVDARIGSVADETTGSVALQAQATFAQVGDYWGVGIGSPAFPNPLLGKPGNCKITARLWVSQGTKVTVQALTQDAQYMQTGEMSYSVPVTPGKWNDIEVQLASGERVIPLNAESPFMALVFMLGNNEGISVTQPLEVRLDNVQADINP